MESISRLVLCLKRNSKTNILVVFDNIKGQNPLPVKNNQHLTVNSK